MTSLDKNECYVVGGGPSLKNFDWSKLQGKFTIAINCAYKVLPDANILYFTDDDFWNNHRDEMKKHGGRLVQGTTTIKPKRTKRDGVEQYLLTGATGLEMEKGHLRHGHNSGYAATNLAIQLGFKRIYLLGIDGEVIEHKHAGTITEEANWHTDHKRTFNRRTIKVIFKGWDDFHEHIKPLNIEVFNCSPTQRLNNLPYFSYDSIV